MPAVYEAFLTSYIIAEAPGETQYSRNTSHVKRFVADDPVSTPGTLSARQDGIVVPTTVPSQALSEVTPAAAATPLSEPPTRSTLSAQPSTENGNEAAHGETTIDRATVPSTPATPSLTQRQRGQRRPPERFKDYVLK